MVMVWWGRGAFFFYNLKVLLAKCTSWGTVGLVNVGDISKVKAHISQRNGMSLCWFPQHEASLGVLLLSPGQDSGPSQGYPVTVCYHYPFIHLSEERQSGVKFHV